MRIKVDRADLEQFVEEQVNSGAYADAEAVVEDALVRLKEEWASGAWTDEELKGAVNVGLEQLARGEGSTLKGDQELDAFFENIKRRGRERLGEQPS